MLFTYFLILLTIESISSQSDVVKVKTSSGLFEGKVLNVLNTTVNQFLGIPYAEPPLGSLRFAKTQPLKKPLEGLIDATKPGKSCMQSNGWKYDNTMIASEDCLVLNIWSKALPLNESETQLKPVMFWIYGGGFHTGTIFQLDLYDGRVLATNDVVVVTVNYRVGVMGFLYGGEESAPGNVGLYDQTQALKWVKQNIHLFGGNPDMITIFGESAGSYAVSALIMSPISRNLFQRAILESGAQFSLIPGIQINKKQGLDIAKQLSKSFNCSDDNQWLNCLRKVDANKLMSYNFDPKIMDGTDFMPNSTEIAFKTGNFRKGIQIMAGVNKDEGTNLTPLKSNATLTNVMNSMKSLLSSGMNLNVISKYYLSNIDTNNETALRLALSKLVGDLWITCPTHFFVEEFTKYSPNDSVYFYELTHTQGSGPFLGCDHEWQGVCHGADIPFVFGLPVLRLDKDKEFSKLIRNIWSHFATTGKPLPTNSTIKWPTFKTSESTLGSNIVELNPTTFGHIFHEPFKSNCDGLWKQYYFEHSF